MSPHNSPLFVLPVLFSSRKVTQYSKRASKAVHLVIHDLNRKTKYAYESPHLLFICHHQRLDVVSFRSQSVRKMSILRH